VDTHPDAPSAPSLLLTLARSADHRRATTDAREAYERLAREHPGTDEAAEARRALRDRSTLRPGQLAPDFERMDAADASLHLAALRGRPVVLVFWRPDDTASAPLWDSLRAIPRDEGERVVLVGIALDDRGLDVARNLESLRPPGRHLWDADGSLATLYAVGPTPRTFLIDADGRIVARDVHGVSLAEKLDPLLSRLSPPWPIPSWWGGHAAR
jgi:peroxiredoxin